MPDPSIQAPKVSLEGSYEPKEFEQSLYSFWEKSGCFESQDESAPGQPAFSIMIPPPNVTGVLHLGHALTATIEDILIRWRRMCGDNTLWLPGMDHAGIATQAQVEKALKKEEGKSRHDIGRDAFLKRTWEWKEKHGGLIFQQLRRLGASCDWKRSRFTMDDGFYDAVRTVFVSLYQDGLIYRGEKIINWCTRCRTALSDLEVEPKERKGFLWHIRYKVVDAEGKVLQDGNKESLLTIATTRPETLLGDTAVAVHSKDERYKKYHGLRVQLPLLNRLIPIIVDDYVDPEFGTGALKVTPAHDFNDYELGLRHDLPFIDVMGKDGTILKEGGPYAGLDFKQARESIIKDLSLIHI